MPRKFDLFWTTMELCDWKDEWNDDKVLRPVIWYLSKQDDQIIFAFDDLMTELLYAIFAVPAAIILVAIGSMISRRIFARHQVS